MKIKAMAGGFMVPIPEGGYGRLADNIEETSYDLFMLRDALSALETLIQPGLGQDVLSDNQLYGLTRLCARGCEAVIDKRADAIDEAVFILTSIQNEVKDAPISE